VQRPELEVGALVEDVAGTIDGAVKFIRYEADAVMPALATRAGGEVVSLD